MAIAANPATKALTTDTPTAIDMRCAAAARSDSRRACLRLTLLLSAAFSAGCVSVPADHGAAKVQALAAERALQLPDPGTAAGERRRLTAELQRQPLTLSSATTLALLNNPRMALVYARLGSAAAEVLQAGRLSNPMLQGAIGFTGTAGAVDRFSFGLAQNFLDLLLLPARSRMAQAEFERAQLEAADDVLALAADVQRAYYDYLAARQVAALQDGIAEAADVSADLALRLQRAGNISALELALQQTAAGQAQLDRLDATLARDNARQALLRVMGLARADAAWDTPSALPLPAALEEPLDALQARAARQRLDLQTLQRRVASVEQRAGSRLAVLRDGSIGVTHERGTDNTRSTGPELTLPLPLFDQGQGYRLASDAALQRARAERDAAQLDVATQVQNAAATVSAAQERLRLLHDRLLPLSAQVVARTQEQTNFMLSDTFELLAARQQQYTAWRRYIEAARDAWLARVDLARAVGGALPSASDGSSIDLNDLLPDRAATPPTSAPPSQPPSTGESR